MFLHLHVRCPLYAGHNSSWHGIWLQLKCCKAY
uniref:Uncharacterized protein n=1 Tax=Anguilla anguilla TaxID=7936 RepID=A0A0E9QLE4_ANGAN